MINLDPNKLQDSAILEQEATEAVGSNPLEQPPKGVASLENRLLEVLSAPIEGLGYRIIYLELQSHRQKVLRIFIDHLGHANGHQRTQDQNQTGPKRIGIEDCVKVSRALEPFLDENLAIQQLLPDAYELEVSSPGADRPLRTAQDFADFVGNWVKIHLFRPLSAEEIENSIFQEKNPKQKNFLGRITGLKDGKVLLDLSDQEQRTTGNFKKGAKKGPKKELNGKSNSLGKEKSSDEFRVCIPLPMISKANLEPQFEFETLSERES